MLKSVVPCLALIILQYFVGRSAAGEVWRNAGESYFARCTDGVERSYCHTLNLTLTNAGTTHELFYDKFCYNGSLQLTLHSFDSGAALRCHRREHPGQYVARDDVLRVRTTAPTLAEEFDPAVVETHVVRGRDQLNFTCRHRRATDWDRVGWLQLDGNNTVTRSIYSESNSTLVLSASLADATSLTLVCLEFSCQTHDCERLVQKVIVLQRAPLEPKAVGEYYWVMLTCPVGEELSISSNGHELFSKKIVDADRELKYKIKAQSFDDGTVARCRGPAGERQLGRLAVRPDSLAREEFEPGVVHEHIIEDYENLEFECSKPQDADEVAWIKLDANNTVVVAHHGAASISRNMTPTADEFAGARLLCASYARRAFYDDGRHVADHYLRTVDKVVLFKGANKTAQSVGEYYWVELSCEDGEEISISAHGHELFSKRVDDASRALKYKIRTQSFDDGSVAVCRGAGGERRLAELSVTEGGRRGFSEYEAAVVHEHVIEDYEEFEFKCSKPEDADEVAWIKLDANNTVVVAHHGAASISRNMTPTADEFAGARLLCASYARRAFYDDGRHVADHYLRTVDKVVLFKVPE